ncbi:response regulator [Puniceicoccaceae bacterium K14]|nr:response regulator [Puniceicoccaceae bacterium K14]
MDQPFDSLGNSPFPRALDNEIFSVTNVQYKGTKILYVDDEPMALKYFVKTFANDFDVLTAASVDEGLELLESKSEQIGVLLTDQRMPKKTGVELLKSVKSKWPDIVPLLITAYSDIDDTIKAVNEGHIYQYIRKPWYPDQLKIMLLQAIQEYNEISYNRKLAETNKKLEDAHRLQEEFIQMLSHEVRTPISVSLSLSEELLESNLNEEQKEHASSIKLVNSALANLLDNTLDYSKWVNGQLKLVERSFSLKTLLKQLDHTFSLQLKMETINYEAHVSENVTNDLLGDPDRLLQILINLIGNAIKFTPVGGTIQLHVAKLESASEHIVLRFAVRDTGEGIAGEAIGKLFKPFSQLQEGKVGTGLGLSISKELVSMMGGEIGVASDIGKGSEFWFTVSLRAQETPIQEAQEPSFKKVENKSVLLADDNRISRYMAQELLGKSGYDVDLANNGVEALNKAKETQYSVILLDCQMPEMDGVEATSRMRAEGKNQHTPIVAITAMPVGMLEDRWLAAGINAYIQKPFDRSKFIETINYWSDSSNIAR